MSDDHEKYTIFSYQNLEMYIFCELGQTWPQRKVFSLFFKSSKYLSQSYLLFVPIETNQHKAE